MWLLYIIFTVLIIGCISECYEELKTIKGILFRVEQNIRESVDEDN